MAEATPERVRRASCSCKLVDSTSVEDKDADPEDGPGELHCLGLTVVGNEAVPSTGLPDESWDVDRLLIYGRGELDY